MILDRMAFEPMTPEQRESLSFSQEKLEEKNVDNSIANLIMGAGALILLGGVGSPLIMSLAIGEKITVMQITSIVVSTLICVGCQIFGIMRRGKSIHSIADTICKNNKGLYTVEEIYDYYREVREDENAVIFQANKNRIKLNGDLYGIFTEHWMKIPTSVKLIAKYPDIVAVWHGKNGDVEGWRGLHILRIDGELEAADNHESFSQKVMEEIAKKNPLTIQAHRFAYEGNTYDVYTNTEQVIQIYKENLAKAQGK